MKLTGHRCEMLFSGDLVRVRWQDSLWGVIRGLEKNSFASLQYSVLVMIVATGFIGTTIFGPYLGLLAAWLTLVAFLFHSRLGKRWYQNVAIVVVSLAALVALSVFAFDAGQLMLDVAAPALGMVALFVAVTVRSLEKQTWRAVAYALGMRRRDALLKSIVQSSTDCIICVDEAGVIKTVNPAASKLFDAPETWTLPALSHGLLYVQQNEPGRAGTKPRLICYDLRAP